MGMLIKRIDGCSGFCTNDEKKESPNAKEQTIETKPGSKVCVVIQVNERNMKKEKPFLGFRL